MEPLKWKGHYIPSCLANMFSVANFGTLNVLLFFLVIRLLSTAGMTASCPYFCSCHTQPSTLSANASLYTVNCSLNQFKVLPTDIPKGTECLLIASNQLMELPDNISDLVHLKELDANNNRIRNLGRGNIFHNLSELIYLNLGKNKLTAIVRDAFSGLLHLKILILAENKLNYLEDHAFYGLNSLSVLDLGRNQFNSLYPEWFYGLPYLQELYFYENRIHLVNSATFRSLKRLQHLSLHGNRISQISTDALWGLSILNTLHLERNYLDTVPVDAIRRLSSLHTLYLSGNPFQSLKAGDFSGLPLEELVLSNLPNLQMVESGTFQNLSRLHTLHLNNCPLLAYVDAEAFVNVTVLQHVNLQNNRLIAVPQQLTAALPAGCELDLKGNPFLCDCNVLWLRQELDLEKGNGSLIRFADADRLLCDQPPFAHQTPIVQLDTARVLPRQCAPSIYPVMASVIQKRLGDPLQLHCRAAGIPKATIQWTIPPGITINKPSIGAHVQIRSSGTLAFRHLKESDAGNYTCTATNAFGSASAGTTLIVKGFDIHLFSTKTASNFVTMVWNGTERNSFPQFQILYRLVGSDIGHFANGQILAGDQMPSATDDRDTADGGVQSQSYNHVIVSPIHRSYTITNLMPDSTYEFCISFKDNSNGDLVQISCAVARTASADYMLQGIHHTSNIAVATVLGIVVVMFMVICATLVAARKYRQRQYVCPDKPVCYRMSNIPLENLYSPLMSAVGP